MPGHYRTCYSDGASSLLEFIAVTFLVINILPGSSFGLFKGLNARPRTQVTVNPGNTVMNCAGRVVMHIASQMMSSNVRSL